ncbi:MAG: phosphodiester glycosidase family protein, partial [Micromonosporaceae bacterium]
MKPRTRRTHVARRLGLPSVAALGLALTLCPAAPATAGSAALTAGPAEAAPPPAAAASGVPLPGNLQPGDADPIETDRRSRPVAPGVTLTSFEELSPHGWVRGDALTTDLDSDVTVDYLDPGEVAKAEPISTQADRQRAVAAVNGDYFDIDNSNAPLGPAMNDGELVKSPSGPNKTVVGIDAAGAGRILQLDFEGSVELPSGVRALDRLNSSALPVDGIGAYTKLWGSHTRGRAVRDADRVAEAVIVDGAVTDVRSEPSEGPIDPAATILVGREQGADALAALEPGDPVQISYRPRTSDGSELTTAVGGRQVLVIDG